MNDVCASLKGRGGVPGDEEHVRLARVPPAGHQLEIAAGAAVGAARRRPLAALLAAQTCQGE